MCGRFALTRNDLESIISDQIDFREFESLEVNNSWNIAPSQDIFIFESSTEQKNLKKASWGFVPSWMKKEPRAKPINARSETAASNGFFRNAWKKSRCLIPASGYYEWKKTDNGKFPYYIFNAKNSPLLMAGLCANSDFGFTAAILTKQATSELTPIHSRMPVILNSISSQLAWLDGTLDLLKHNENLNNQIDLDSYMVSKHVNSPKNNDSKCIEEVKEDAFVQEQDSSIL